MVKDFTDKQKSKTYLYLIRHTRLNIEPGICYGQSDVDVYPLFEKKAEKISKRLRKIKFDQIYSSPLQRCSKLAQVLSNGQEIIFDNRLKEINFGDWEMKRWKDIADETKEVFRNYNFTTPCPNGESFIDLKRRVNDFLTEIKKTSRHSDICIVTHGGPIRAFISIIKNKEPLKLFQRKVDYGAIIKLELN